MPEYISGRSESGTESDGYELYALFTATSFPQLESMLIRADSRDAKAFYRALLNLKLQIAQEKIVGEELL
ncbi:MAG: hypothetical protein K6D94_10205 [Clostridiales bacterium]|jgi:hypothetical protein|nr:hypothetical protein [Clostridiales bacterium]